MRTTAPPSAPRRDPARGPGGPGAARRSIRAILTRYAIFTRYAIGSVLAGVASEAVLLLTYGSGLLSAQVASVAGWVAGAVLNYGLNRRWAWGRRGRADLVRELLPYWTITLVSLAVSVWATGLADRIGPRLFDTEGLRVMFVGGAFLAVYGLMFIVKFVLYHYLVFPGRSRHQVPTTTRK